VNRVRERNWHWHGSFIFPNRLQIGINFVLRMNIQQHNDDNNKDDTQHRKNRQAKLLCVVWKITINFYIFLPPRFNFHFYCIHNCTWILSRLLLPAIVMLCLLHACLTCSLLLFFIAHTYRAEIMVSELWWCEWEWRRIIKCNECSFH
jgi:hypothetical protein